MKVELIAESPGEEAGIRSVTYQINGPNAYGWLKTGVRACTGWCASRRSIQRARRHTSFSSVWVYPVVDDNIEIEIAAERHPHRHLPLVRAPAGSTSTPPTRRCASPTCRPTSW